MSKLTGIIITLSALLLVGCTPAQETWHTQQVEPTFTTSIGALVAQKDTLGAAQEFCTTLLNAGTTAEADCYDYAKKVCFSADTTYHPQEPLRGYCTRRWESYGGTTGNG
jgi:hypothetical protein